MKLHPDPSYTLRIAAHGPGWLEIALPDGQRERHLHSVILHTALGSDGAGLCQAWSVLDFPSLVAADFASLLQAWQASPSPSPREDQPDSLPEILLFGSGAKQRFCPQSWLAPWYQAGIGVETMDSSAACRTFNILAQEGRRVAAAILLESDATS